MSEEKKIDAILGWSYGSLMTIAGLGFLGMALITAYPSIINKINPMGEEQGLRAFIALSIIFGIACLMYGIAIIKECCFKNKQSG